MARTRRTHGNGLDAWPGYVDALSTLLMVIIFVLLVFVLAQAFLSVVLSGRNKALDQATQELAQITQALSLEKSQAADLRLSVARLAKQLDDSNAVRDAITRQLTTLRSQRDAANADLAGARQQLDEMKRQAAELDKTVKADKETIQARLSDLAALTEQLRALSALRDELEKKAGDAAARVVTEQQRRDAVAAQLADEKKLGDSARAQIALLNKQIDELKAQLSGISDALQLAKTQNKTKDTEIANLTQRLNVALADKVQELQQYRSEFFGRLRAVLANRPGIQVVGDRFVFQSEVLFPVGSADLTPAGVSQITTLAITIKDLMSDIPPDLNWILRVDGHTDPQPLKGNGIFASNWELSAGRAISVVKLLIADGVPADRLAATAFGEYQPFGPGDTPEAYAKDRRIELRLTDR